MYLLPDDLHRYYRPLPFLLKFGNILVSAWVSALLTWKRHLPTLPIYYGLRKVSHVFSHTTSSSLDGSGGIATAGTLMIQLSKVIAFLMRFILCTLVFQISIQEVFCPPSRVSMSTLLQRYFLPSPLSKYQKVTLPPPSVKTTKKGVKRDMTLFSTGVHYLEYHNKNLTSTASSPSPASFDALYFQHGFGASSLSWLPAIPPLVQRMKARVAYGHDAPGFGFTDRPKHLRWYTHRSSAWIAQQVMNIGGNGAEDESKTMTTRSSSLSDMAMSNDDTTKTVGLFGHSMGSLTILRLALDLPRETSKFIVLSSPALGIRHIPKKAPKIKTSSKSSNKNNSLSSWIRKKTLVPFNKALTKCVLDPAGRYILRRVIGTQGSWRNGLKLAWGDPGNLSESDVTRFSWPSIGMGWEQGILNFSRAQMTHIDDDDDENDHELDDDKTLVQRVSELPNTKVVVILGSKDRIVPSQQVRKFFEPFPDVPIVELDGLGHDAFEEGTDTFCDTVERLIDDHWGR
jgi:pimeloyl-ACP methyl ester carboxylesterase